MIKWSSFTVQIRTLSLFENSRVIHQQFFTLIFQWMEQSLNQSVKHMKFYSSASTAQRTLVQEHQTTKKKFGSLIHLDWDGTSRESGLLVLMGQILTQLIDILTWRFKLQLMTLGLSNCSDTHVRRRKQTLRSTTVILLMSRKFDSIQRCLIWFQQEEAIWQHSNGNSFMTKKKVMRFKLKLKKTITMPMNMWRKK